MITGTLTTPAKNIIPTYFQSGFVAAKEFERTGVRYDFVCG